MRRVTKYEVSGVVDSKPTDLPEGLEVKEILVDLPPESIQITPIHGGPPYSFHEFPLTGARGTGVQVQGMGIFQESEVRKLRDFCNKVLGENPGKMRVLEDTSGDWWFELVPGLFTFGSKYVEGKTALADAQTNRDLNDGRYIDWTEDRLRSEYARVYEVTDTWEG